MAWPSTGSTTARPRKQGSDPITSSAATNRPHTAMLNGLIMTAARRCQDRIGRAGMPIEHQRERHDADAQRDHGEQEADTASHQDQHAPFSGGENAVDEIGNAGRGLMAEGGDVDRIGCGNPDHEQCEQDRTQSEHSAERWRTQHAERVPRGGLFAALAAAAELGTDRARRTGRPARSRQRAGKQQRQNRITENDPRQRKSEDRMRIMHSITAWLGIALKSSQPRRSASRRSAVVMLRITIGASTSDVRTVIGVTLSGCHIVGRDHGGSPSSRSQQGCEEPQRARQTRFKRALPDKIVTTLETSLAQMLLPRSPAVALLIVQLHKKSVTMAHRRFADASLP